MALHRTTVFRLRTGVPCVWLAAFICLLDRTEASSKGPVYTDRIAVEIHGGPEEADRVALRYGFINEGQVSTRSHACAAIVCRFATLTTIHATSLERPRVRCAARASAHGPSTQISGAWP